MAEDNQQANSIPRSVKGHPSILAACLKDNQVPAARLYLLQRAIDQAGRGVADIAQLRATFTDKKSKLYICGWRRLRQILNDGRGIFWQRDRTRLWLFSPARIAVALGVERLSGLPVAIPTAALLRGKHETAAAFYAAWHAGRKENRPISRPALHEITGAASSTQRTYCKTAKIKRENNIRITGDYTPENIQKTAWKYGNVFCYTDQIGQRGEAGATYTAYNRPSSYFTKLKKLPHGRQRKINKAIRLVNSVERGNGHCEFEHVRTNHEDAAAAWKAREQHPHHDHYYKRRLLYRVTAMRKPRMAVAREWECLEAKTS